MRGVERLGDRLHLGRRAIDGRAIGQPSEHAQRGERAMALLGIGLGPRPERAGGRGHVDVALDRVLRERRQHADDRVRPVVHPQHAADHAGLAAELRLPVLVAQDEHGLRADVVVALAERAAEQRPHAEHVEEVGGDDRGLDPVGLPLVQQHERHRVELDQVPDRLEAGAIVVQLLDRDAGVVDVRRRRRLLDEHELVPVREGQRREQHAANHGEHGRVRADAEREHADGRGRVAGRAAERATAEADVLPERVPESDASHVVSSGAHHGGSPSAWNGVAANDGQRAASGRAGMAPGPILSGRRRSSPSSCGVRPEPA